MNANISIPKAVSIKPEHYAKLKELHAEQVALDGFISRVLNSGKQQMAAINGKLKEAWVAIAKDHNIDIQNINWAPSPTESIIVPVSMQISSGPSRQ